MGLQGERMQRCGFRVGENTMNLLVWMGSGYNVVLGGRDDEPWPWITVLLSALIVFGYGVVAFNWLFQTKLARDGKARPALARLRNICLCCGACGSAFWIFDTPWIVWRAYDAALLCVVIYAWSSVLRTRGLSLVTERLAHLSEIEQSAEKYREIAELLPHMVWTATSDGRVDFSNQRWRSYVGGNHTWLEAVHPEERRAARARWDAAMAARTPLTLEARLGGVTGYRSFVIKATPIVHGDAVKWLGACADVEDQKLLAAEKERQAKQKSFFLNALSHDLRAPLHNVLLNAHLLRMSARDAGDLESVQMIEENAVAAGDLVTKLLDYAKVGAQDDNVVEAVSVAAVLQQVARRFQPLSEQKGLYLRVADAGDGDDVRLATDRQKLERILANLVDNAIKYTEQGGVSVGLAARGHDGDEIALRVSDTGIGIPRENVPFLFDEFYQVNNYERDRSKGFGMGLAICRCLAQHIGGDVRLTSTGPQGSCFEVVVRSANLRDIRGVSGIGAKLGDGVDPDSGRRSGGASGRRADPETPRLCGV